MNDAFEKKLQAQTLRSAPDAWRSEILAQAQKAAATPAARPEAPVTLRNWLASLLWPCPQAWAGLATIWAVILGLNFLGNPGGPSESMARNQSAPPAKIWLAWQEQRALLAQFTEPARPEPAERPKPFVPLPRSERATPWAAV